MTRRSRYDVEGATVATLGIMYCAMAGLTTFVPRGHMCRVRLLMLLMLPGASATLVASCGGMLPNRRQDVDLINIDYTQDRVNPP